MLSISRAPSKPLRFTTPFAKAALVGLAVALAPALAFAGAQGPGLGNPPGPSEEDLEKYWMNQPGEPVPSFVCVDTPAIPCFELDAAGPTLISPDCPGNSRACRPAEIPGTVMTGTLALEGVPSSEWTRTDVSDLYPYDGCEFGGNHATQNVQPADLDTVSDPAIGSQPYVNTSIYTLESFPADLGCAQWIRTDSNDFASTAAVEVSFDLGRYEYVYIAYDANATQIPSWLAADYVATGQTVVNRILNINDVNYDLYRSREILPLGASIQIPGNRAGGGDGGVMYMVFVRPPSATEYCGGWSGTVSLDTPAGPVVTQQIGGSGCGIQDESSVSIEPPVLLPGGLGWYVGGPMPCDGLLADGQELEYERAFGPTGFFDRGALIDAAQAANPALCDADPTGACQLRPAVTMVGPTGAMETGTATANPEVCTFTVRFTEPGESRIVIHGDPADDVDTAIETQVSATIDEPGVISDIDVYVRTSANYADNLEITLYKDPWEVLLDDRPGCDNRSSFHDVWFDDEAGSGQPNCGTQSGRALVDDLIFAAGRPAKGTYTLGFRDGLNPGDGTDLLDWQLRIKTFHTACSDDIDNDADDAIDWDGGPVPESPDADCTHSNDVQEAPGSACGLGAEVLPALALLGWRRARRKA